MNLGIEMFPSVFIQISSKSKVPLYVLWPQAAYSGEVSDAKVNEGRRNPPR